MLIFLTSNYEQSLVTGFQLDDGGVKDRLRVCSCALHILILAVDIIYKCTFLFEAYLIYMLRCSLVALLGYIGCPEFEQNKYCTILY